MAKKPNINPENIGAGLGELKARLLFLMFALFVYRIGTHIPVPGIDPLQLASFFDQNEETFLGLFNMFSGGALERMSIVALGIMPYISASIIMQLLSAVSPQLDQLKKEGESGRRKITQYTRYGALVLATFQGTGMTVGLLAPMAINPGIAFNLTAIISLVTGAMFLMWLGEQITEKGIGNGLSLIIFGGIVASFPTLFNQIRQSDTGFAGIAVVVIVAVVLIALIVLFQEAQRRIPVQYARSQFRGGRMYRQSGQSFIPLRVNSAGMIPLIFAFSIIIFPSVVAGWFSQGGSDVNTVAAVEVPFADEDGDETLVTLFPGIDAEGSFRVNDGEISYIASEDSFEDVLRRINRDSDANVLTQLLPVLDDASGEFVPTWTIESNESGGGLIEIEDLEVGGNFVAITQVPTHIDGTDDRFTPAIVEGQKPGERPPWVARAGGWVEDNFSPGRPLYWALSFVLVVGFTFFYTLITFQQQNLAENLQKQGGFVPGIRPGRPTQDYINKVLFRITWAGALFLGFVAVVPFLATEFIPDSNALTLSSTGLLIVVGVALDTMKQVEAQLLMRNYEGFIR